MPRKLSCAALLLEEPGRILLCHLTGTRWWDVPKGLQEPGETPRQTALRELAEETGLVLPHGALLDLGRVAYRPDKDLHLFAAAVAAGVVDLDRCHCSSHFTHPRTGRRCPEVDAYAWLPFAEIPGRCSPNMARVLTEALRLPEVLRRLAVEGGTGAPEASRRPAGPPDEGPAGRSR
jgi:8-oxo-dGTP pyrophosphatase MutT (NUDIX family)